MIIIKNKKPESAKNNINKLITNSGYKNKI